MVSSLGQSGYKLTAQSTKKPCALLLSFTNDSPEFGELLDILLIEDEVYFHVQLQETVYFTEHFQAYIIRKRSTKQTIDQAKLLNFLPLHIRSIRGLNPGERAVIL